jgi:putative membrane protein
MEYMFQAGFLGTRAPLFMDEFIVVVALLPFLIGASIWFAIKESYKLHRIMQTLLFVITLGILIYFEYGIQVGGGFSHYIKDSSINPDFAYKFLIFHIIIASITLVMWAFIVHFATADRKRRALPGLYSNAHKKSGRRVAFMILLTSLTGIGVYWMLFIA